MGNTTMYPMSVILTVRDAAKSVAWYRDVLGFKLEQSWPDETKPMWANLVLDGQSVMLGQMMDPASSGDMSPTTRPPRRSGKCSTRRCRATSPASASRPTWP
jgi:catechol 2,3-dioxygenase-like lactoylglutathione lyase family enzyme